MDIYFDTLIHLPLGTVESVREIDGIVYFKIELLNKAINCLNCKKKIDEIHEIEYGLIREISVLGSKEYLQVRRRQVDNSD